MSKKKSVVLFVAMLAMGFMSLNCLAHESDSGSFQYSWSDTFEKIKALVSDFFMEFIVGGASSMAEQGQTEPTPGPDLGVSIDPRS